MIPAWRRFLSSWLLSVFLTVGTLAAASRSHFLIFPAGADIRTETRRLESLGARVRQRVPPRILVAELPDSVPITALSIDRGFTGPIDLALLDVHGTLAVAVGVQWNRRLLTESRATGT